MDKHDDDAIRYSHVAAFLCGISVGVLLFQSTNVLQILIFACLTVGFFRVTFWLVKQEKGNNK